MKKHGRLLTVLAGALLVLSLLAGAAASKELVVYSSVDEENAKNILDEFSKATGIRVNMVFLSSGPAMSRIEAERGTPRLTCGSAPPAKTTSWRKTGA